ncbi:hypothetical protein SDC9_128683 [bioreactor metagenome]|uniref:DUF3788 domain-containing protein n=1 Tax=bioreactor metagenome TaxID=1076179 RepID=A0A645CXJ5_9ZZZZ|nr:DUF3788 domain-containing protein [Candidatus Metalachnospira sp.]
MLEKIPSNEDLEALIGNDLFNVWMALCTEIEQEYEMDRSWNSAGKAWTYEYKYRRGGKTLCALYARENCIGFMIIFGKDERAKFEANRDSCSAEVNRVYDESITYHDGKWMMFELKDTALFGDMIRLLAIKRRPNKK